MPKITKTYEAVRTVRTFLLEQGGPATTLDRIGEALCAYRGDNGRKCAVGCLIPDSEYDPYIEGLGVGTIGKKYFPKSLMGIDRAFLAKMQSIHDTFNSKNDRAESLNELPREWDEYINDKFDKLEAELDEI